jgi:EAL domain-containing protein (putative c-di-GMP-specific phosphodiesterase class I)
VARAIVDLGATFQLKVVAEGIESLDQHSQLLLMGCDLGQGYLFARPAPASEVTPMLSQRRAVPQPWG